MIGAMRIVKPNVYPMPKTRDPIVNTVLLPLGPDRRGAESFWISTYNRCSGTIGLRLDEWGRCRAYPFPWQHEGFYSSVHEGAGILWLCGRLDRVVRLNLKTGTYKVFETGVAKARVFEGMAYDPETGKLLILSQPFHSNREVTTSTAVSFDTRARRTAKIHQTEILESTTRCSFPNGDGTFTLTVQIPGESLVRWDPRADSISTQVINSTPVIGPDNTEKLTCRLISDDAGRHYFPDHGWYDGIQGAFESDGPTPDQKMTWFARRGQSAYGARIDGSDVTIHSWEMKSGQIEPLFTIPDCDVFNVNLTASGRVVAVNAFGVFYRFDVTTRALECTRRLPTDNIGDSLAVCRIDRDRVLGANYISSRFWELNLQTGEGMDCGRAQVAWGQICHIGRVGRLVYMTAYGSGQLMEYDPDRPLCYPDNPRVVADAPGGMRPVAWADDGRNVFYSCSMDYGRLGCVLTRYDTATGRVRYAVNPLADQQVCGMAYSPASQSLICATTFHSDSMSCRPTSSRCRLAEMDASTLEVSWQHALPEGPAMARICGPLADRRWLVTLHHHVSHPPVRWMVLDTRQAAACASTPQLDFPADFRGSIQYAGKPGLFILNIDDRLELWDMVRLRSRRVLFRPFDPARFDGYSFAAQGHSLLVLQAKNLLVVEGCLKGVRDACAR